MSPSRPELFGELLIGADDMALASPVAGAAAVEESGVAGAVAAASAPEAAAAEASALASCFLQAETDMAAAPIRATPTRRRVEVVVICCPLVIADGRGLNSSGPAKVAEAPAWPS